MRTRYFWLNLAKLSTKESIGLKPVSVSERGQDTLAGLAVLTKGLGDLEVLIKNTVLEATFEPEEHTPIILQIKLLSRGSQNYLGTTFAGKIGFFKRKPLIM